MYAEFKEMGIAEQREYALKPYAVHSLVSSGCNEVTIDTLVSYGANVCVVDSDGLSPLCYAVKYQNLGAVKGLLRHTVSGNSISPLECPVQRAVLKISKLGTRKIRPHRVALAILKELLSAGLRCESPTVMRAEIFKRVKLPEVISLILDAGFLHPVRPLLRFAYGITNSVNQGNITYSTNSTKPGKPRINLILELTRRGHLPKKGFESRKCVKLLTYCVGTLPVKEVKKLLEVGFKPCVYSSSTLRLSWDPLYKAAFLYCDPPNEQSGMVDLLLAYNADITRNALELALDSMYDYPLISMLAVLHNRFQEQNRHPQLNQISDKKEPPYILSKPFYLREDFGFDSYNTVKLCILSNILNRNAIDIDFTIGGFVEQDMERSAELVQDKRFPTLFDVISHHLVLQERLEHINKYREKSYFGRSFGREIP